MAEKLNKRLVVTVGGAVILIAVVAGVYMMFLRPQMAEWREVKRNLKDKENELKRLQKAFLEQENPKIVLRILQQETNDLTKANRALAKIKRRGTEMKDLPEELKDADPSIEKAMIDEYITALMKNEEEIIEKNLIDAKIDPPEINLFSKLNGTEEAPYYINRKTGLQGIINALIKTQNSTDKRILFQDLGLEDYNAGSKRRKASINILSYLVVLTLDMDNLISFLYNLNDEEGYYYVENINIKPATRHRFGGEDVKLLVDARINTVMIYESEMKKTLQRAVAASASGVARAGRPKGQVGGFLALAQGMQQTTEQQIREQETKKWYEFWK